MRSPNLPGNPSPIPSVSSPADFPHFPRLLHRVRALAHRSARDTQRAFFLEGLRSFIQAHDAGWTFQTLVYSPVLLKGDLPDMLARRLHRTGIPRLRLTPEQFGAISRTARASGIGAIVRQQWHPLGIVRKGLCHLVIEHIRCPGNLGTILRTAEATGVASVVLVGNLTDPFEPAAVRASMGGIFHVPLVRATHAEFTQWVRAQSVQLIGLAPDAARLWTQVRTLGARALLAIVLGEERQGLSPHLRSLCTDFVKLPMTGRADSLNVSIAAAVMLYELMRRQRHVE